MVKDLLRAVLPRSFAPQRDRQTVLPGSFGMQCSGQTVLPGFIAMRLSRPVGTGSFHFGGSQPSAGTASWIRSGRR